MVTEPLHNAAEGKRVFGPDKVNIQQHIPSDRAAYY
jgi:hypothetical protein